jgi:hypothetical protein
MAVLVNVVRALAQLSAPMRWNERFMFTRISHSFFQQLAELQVYHITYLNYEAITEVPEVEDYFKEATLFKKNPV